MKTCILCEHFEFESATRGFSSRTPGDAAIMSCNKNHFYNSLGSISENEYRENLLKANSCTDFQIAKDLT